MNSTMGAASLKKTKGEIPVVKKMKDYSKEPVFLQKAEKAAAFLAKHGLPGTIARKKK